MSIGVQYNTQSLIDNIIRRCLVPTSQLTYLPADFCALASDTLQEEVVPLIMSTREEMFVDYIDFASPANNIIQMPSNTVASKIRSLCYLQQSNPNILINLPRVDLDVVAGIGFASFNTVTGFYIQGNQLVLYPNTSLPANTLLRMFYYRRALVLIDPSLYGQVTQIDAMTNTLTFNSFPFSWTTSSVLNSVSDISPFAITNPLMNVVSLSSPTVTVDSVAGVSVGDYVSDYGTSAIPQVPIECHGYLAQLTAAKCLEGLGALEGMKAALEKAASLKESMFVMISQRVDGSVKKIINPGGGIRLASSLGYRRNGTGGGFW